MSLNKPEDLNLCVPRFQKVTAVPEWFFGSRSNQNLCSPASSPTPHELNLNVRLLGFYLPLRSVQDNTMDNDSFLVQTGKRGSCYGNCAMFLPQLSSNLGLFLSAWLEKFLFSLWRFFSLEDVSQSSILQTYNYSHNVRQSGLELQRPSHAAGRTWPLKDRHHTVGLPSGINGNYPKCHM